MLRFASGDNAGVRRTSTAPLNLQNPRAMSQAVAPLFLPCAAGVEALLAEEIGRLLPKCRVIERRGGVALEGGLHEVMLLNLESRLAQRVSQSLVSAKHDLFF